MLDRRVVIAIGTIGLLNVMSLNGSGLLHSYDAQTHLFFADHYLKAWWNPWDAKWFDGMWVISYPPLVHQLIAAIGSVSSLELGYRIVQGAALLLFPGAIYLLGVETVGPRYAPWAALLAVGVPGVYVELYTWGQLPSFVGMVLGVTAAAFFGRYLRGGSRLSLATCAGLTGAAAAAHHHTVIFILPLVYGGMIGRWWLARRPAWKKALVRPVVAGLLCGLTGAAAILPFWWWFATQNLPQAELPHPSREGIFRNPADAELFFWGVYGAFLVLTPAGLAMMVARRRTWWPLALVIILLGLLGLGTLTPLPQALFGYHDLWLWLVYDRFAIWAAVLCTLPASLCVERIARSRARWLVGPLVAVALLAGVARESTFAEFQPLVPRPLQTWEENEIVHFLTDDNHASWNYVTFGLGDPEMARLSRLAAARTLDGLYYTARQRPELRASGVGSIDTAYWWRTGLEIIPQILQQPDRWNLRWAVVAIPQMEDQLRAAGWHKLNTLGTPVPQSDVPALFFHQSAETQATFRGVYGDAAALAWAAEHGAPAQVSLVSLWEAPASVVVAPLLPAVAPEYPGILSVWWGTAPLVLLAVSCLLIILHNVPAPPWTPGLRRARTRLGRRQMAVRSMLGAVLPGYRP